MKMRGIFSYLLVLPPFIVLALFYFYPFAYSVLISFTDSKGEFTLENYRRALELFRGDIIFTIWLCALSTVVTGLIAILLAAYLRLSDSPLKKYFKALYRLPLFFPMVVVAQMMRDFLSPHGYLNLMLAELGVIDLSNPPYFLDWKGVLLGFLWKQLPFMTLITLSGFLMVGDEYIEAAKSVGAGPLRILWNILIPMSRSSIAIAFILVYASNMSTLSLPYMIIGGAKPTTITVDMAFLVTYLGDWGTANALGVISYLAVGAFSAYYLHQMVKRGAYD